LQTLYTLSDEQTEYQVKDRLSFMRFVGLALHDPVPDAKTIWLYREQLARAGAAEKLFVRFEALLRERGWLAISAQIIGATMIEARRPQLTGRRRTRSRMAAPRPSGHRPGDREGVGPSGTGGSAKPHRASTKAEGRDRRADVRRQKPHRHRPRARPQLQRKAPKGKKTPDHIARGNATRARVRPRVKHLLAAQKCRLGLVIRTVGMVRARLKIGLAQSGLQSHPAGLAHGRLVPA
jgi:IS5 family transposase